MRTKTVQIQHCGDCPHRYYDQDGLACDKTGKSTYENGEIPEWCPLEETINNQQTCISLREEELKTIVHLIVEGIISQWKSKGFKERRPNRGKEK